MIIHGKHSVAVGRCPPAIYYEEASQLTSASAAILTRSFYWMRQEKVPFDVKAHPARSDEEAPSLVQGTAWSQWLYINKTSNVELVLKPVLALGQRVAPHQPVLGELQLLFSPECSWNRFDGIDPSHSARTTCWCGIVNLMLDDVNSTFGKSNDIHLDVTEKVKEN